MMKIDLAAIDRTQFYVNPHEIAGETCWLVNPQQIGVVWTEDNLHLRSSLWNSEGELISASFPKFHNWSERPELNPAPADLSDAELIEKIDGSTLIVSTYKDHVIVRTRGTVDAVKLDNGHEIAGLQAKYPNVFKPSKLCGGAVCSYIYEWTSPNQRIVIDYGPNPDLTLIGGIIHLDYRLWTQDQLDYLSTIIGVKRPRRYSFGSISDMVNAVEKMDGQEGICVYYNGGQSIRKVKGARYLFLHRLKSELGSISKVLDLYLAHMENELLRIQIFSSQSFYDYIAKTFDFEIAEQVKPFIIRIQIAHSCAEAIITDVRAQVVELRSLSRKEAALAIIAKYKESGLSGIAFLALDNKSIPTKTLRELIERELDKTS